MSVSRFLALTSAIFLLTGAAGSCGPSADKATAEKATADKPASTPAPLDTLGEARLMNRADQGRLLGPDSAMWVVMISDFQCPYCKRWHDESMANFRREYVETGKVRFAYLHLPLESIHPHARAQAEAATCAGVQGKFWPFADAIFAGFDAVKGMSNVNPLLERYARELKLDMAAYEQCRMSRAVKVLIQNDIQQATQAGVESTPSFVIGEFLVRGALPWPDFRKAVDTALIMHRQRTKAQKTAP